MKRSTTILTAALLCLLLVLGCGMLSKKTSVPKEQIDADIAKKVVDTQEGTEKKWVFEADDQRCFSVVDGESKATDAGADVMVNVSSYQDMSMGGDQKVITVFGKMLMKYKKNGDKWTLDSIEPKDLITKTLTMDQFKQWLDIQMPNCKYSRYTK